MKILSLIALTALAQETFAAHPKVDKVFGTADGNIFLPDAHNAARNHARDMKLEVHEISRTGSVSDDVLDHIETDAEANETKREGVNADAAKQAAAQSSKPVTGADVSPEAAAAAKAAGIAKAVKKGPNAKDTPAAKATSSKPATKKAAAPKAATPAAPVAATTPEAPGAPAADTTGTDNE